MEIVVFFLVEVSNKYQYVLKRENVNVNWTKMRWCFFPLSECYLIECKEFRLPSNLVTWVMHSAHNNNSTKFLTQSRIERKTYPIFDGDACIIRLIAIVLPTVIIMGVHRQITASSV